MAVGRDGTADRSRSGRTRGRRCAASTPGAAGRPSTPQALSDRIAAIAGGLRIEPAEASVADGCQAGLRRGPGSAAAGAWTPTAVAGAVALAARPARCARRGRPPRSPIDGHRAGRDDRRSDPGARLTPNGSPPRSRSSSARRSSRSRRRKLRPLDHLRADRRRRLRSRRSTRPRSSRPARRAGQEDRPQGRQCDVQDDRQQGHRDRRQQGRPQARRAGHGRADRGAPGGAGHREAATELRPALTVTEPVLTTAEAKAAAPKMKKISELDDLLPDLGTERVRGEHLDPGPDHRRLRRRAAREVRLLGGGRPGHPRQGL